MNLRLQLLTGCATLLAIATTASANLLTNSSFELGSGTAIDNWFLVPTAAGRTVADYPTATGSSPYGPRFLSFNADLSTPGGNATQDFGPLDPDTEYELSFAYGAFGTDGPQTLEVTINTTSAPLPLDTIVVTTPGTDFSTLWQRATYRFTGALNFLPSGVTFADLGVTLTGDSDLLVDDVSLVAVPEPSSFALAGIAAAAFGWFRCRNPSPPSPSPPRRSEGEK